MNRGWTIEAVDEKSVLAAINHSSSDAKLRITLLNGQLLYEGSAIKTMRSGGSGAAPAQLHAIRREGDVPKRWIEYLRRDMAGILAAMPETPN